MLSNKMSVINPEEVRSLWVTLVLNAARASDTPLTQAFFSIENVNWLKSEMERRLQRKLSDPTVKYLITEEFVTSMIDMALNNYFYAYDVEKGLPLLNQYLLNKEVEITYLGQRQRKLYETQMLQGNRMRVFPYGLGDKTLHVRGENQVTQAPYQLNHPFKTQYQAYLDQVLHVNRPSCPTVYRCTPFPAHPNP